MIPKVIHYCWFGNNSKSEDTLSYINSWRKYFPDYEIKEWTEEDFDINCCNYVKEAYTEEKWAFVADYARFWIIYNYGGVYFDTDVEVIKGMQDIIDKGAFMGQEPLSIESQKFGTRKINVNPGLGMGAEAGNTFCKKMLEIYEKIHFIDAKGNVNEKTIVEYVSDLLCRKGMKETDEVQSIESINIYPVDYFCPLNYKTGKLNLTENTRTIHHYSATWKSEKERRFGNGIKVLSNAFGETTAYRIERIITSPKRIIRKIKKLGWRDTIQFILKSNN